MRRDDRSVAPLRPKSAGHPAPRSHPLRPLADAHGDRRVAARRPRRARGLRWPDRHSEFPRLRRTSPRAELAFAKLKAFLRAARPRTFDHVSALVATALELFTPTECRNYVRHCGYRVT